MRDITQVSITIYNPYSGAISGGSKIQPIEPPVDVTDGFLDEFSYLFDDSDCWIDAELWSAQVFLIISPPCAGFFIPKIQQIPIDNISPEMYSIAN